MLKHFEQEYSKTVETIAAVIANLNQNEIAALYECLSVRLNMLDAIAAPNFKRGDTVYWYHKTKTRVYLYGGTVTSPGTRVKILAKTGGNWTVPARMLTKEKPHGITG